MRGDRPPDRHNPNNGENMLMTTNPVERHDKEELMIVAVKIPRVLVALLDNAADHSWDTRNAIVKKAIEQYFAA